MTSGLLREVLIKLSNENEFPLVIQSNVEEAEGNGR